MTRMSEKLKSDVLGKEVAKRGISIAEAGTLMNTLPRKQLYALYLAGACVLVPIFVIVLACTLGYWKMAVLLVLCFVGGLAGFYGTRLALTNYFDRVEHEKKKVG